MKQLRLNSLRKSMIRIFTSVDNFEHKDLTEASCGATHLNIFKPIVFSRAAGLVNILYTHEQWLAYKAPHYTDP